MHAMDTTFSVPLWDFHNIWSMDSFLPSGLSNKMAEGKHGALDSK